MTALAALAAGRQSASYRPAASSMGVPDLVLAYGGCALVALMPVLAAGKLVVSPVFFRAILIVAICGLLFSILIRSLGGWFNHQRWRPVIAFLVLTMTALGSVGYLQTTSFWHAVVGLRGFRGMLTVSTAESYVALVHLFLIFHVVRTFSILTDKDLVLTIIPSLSTLVLLCLFQREMGIVPYFIPLAFGVLMLLLFSHRAAIYQERDWSAFDDAEGRTRRRGFIMSLRALATTALLSVALAAGLTSVFQGGQHRSMLLDRVGLELAMRLARQIVTYAHSAEVSPISHFYLGGETFQLSPRELFQVDSREPHYWRGNTLDVYNGIGWSQTRHSLQVHPMGSGVTDIVPQDPGLQNGIPAKEAVQHVKLLVPHTGLFVCAYEPVRVQADLPKTGPRHRSTVRVDDASSAYFNGILRTEAEYSITSRVKALPEKHMVGAESRVRGDKSERLSPDLHVRYLDLPPLSSRVTALGRRFAERQNPLDRVEAIVSFVHQRVQYTLSPPYMPWDREAVDYLLFETRKGYCTHYATAVAVLCRLTGIPSRMVTGYAPGDYDAETEIYHVKELHAHAWTEVFLPRYGWHAVDASPVVDLGAILEKRREHREGLWAQLRNRLMSWNFRGALMPIAMVAGGLLAVAVAFVTYGIHRTRAGRRGGACVVVGSSHQSVRQAYRRMCRLLSHRFRVKQATETPNEYLSALGDWQPALLPAAQQLTDLYVSALYANSSPAEACDGQLRQLLRTLQRGCRCVRRWKK